MPDITSNSSRALLVTGAVLLWIVALLWGLGHKGYIEAPAFVGGAAATSAAPDEPQAGAAEFGDEQVSEIIVEAESESAPAPAVSRRRVPSNEAELEDESETEGESEEPQIPTYAVWFESERSIGVCKISYEGGSKTANLHVSARVPEGTLAFRYRCGKHSGSGRINVKAKRVNGVLFCKRDGGVKVQTVRSKEGRCARS